MARTYLMNRLWQNVLLGTATLSLSLVSGISASG